MCAFINFSFPPSKLDQIEKLFKKNLTYLKKIEKLNYPYIGQQLPAQRQYYYPEIGTCHCHFPLGSLSKDEKDEEEKQRETKKLIRKIERLKKKGWSETKIARWKQDLDQAENKNQKAREESYERFKVDPINWVNFIQEAMKITETFGLVRHWYSGTVKDEEIKIKEVIKCPPETLSEYYLLKMDYDKLYLFGEQRY